MARRVKPNAHRAGFQRRRRRRGTRHERLERVGCLSMASGLQPGSLQLRNAFELLAESAHTAVAHTPHDTQAGQPNQDAQLEAQDMEGDEVDQAAGPWTPWQRRRPTRKTAITRLDRVSRPRSLLLLRPLTKISVRDIPKTALATLIGTTAPSEEHAELSTHRYDVAGNCIQITVYDVEHATRLSNATRLSYTYNAGNVSVPIEVKMSPHRPNTSRGVITVEPDDDNATILQWLRCEQAEVLAAQRIGKTNRAVITFDSPTLPRVVKYYMAIVPVSPYAPKRMVCFNCHSIGHMAKYCPKQPVCRKCGHMHADDDACERTLFCVACQENGHLAVNPTCPSRVVSEKSKQERKANSRQDNKEPGVSWSDIIRGHGYTSNTSSQPTKEPPPVSSLTNGAVNQAILAQLESLRHEMQQLRAENRRLKEELAALRQGPPSSQTSQLASSADTLKQSTAQKSRPKSSSRPSRSKSVKRTPSSQMARKQNVDTSEVMQVLALIRGDLQRERLSRQEAIEKIRIRSEQHIKQATAMIQYLTGRISESESCEEPPRKVAHPKTGPQ